jgi:serine/threonine-protein kinase
MESGLQPQPREQPVQFGKYILLSRIALGGMGELYLAQLRAAGGFEKLVVIKRILPHLTDQREFVQMFVEEARTAARISHPNVCQIYELGRIEGRYYMALEYLEGIPLARVMVGRKRAPQLADLRLVAALVSQAAEGLHHAHSLRSSDGASEQLVHGDVNPRNIFVTSTGVAKVLDFGIVKVRGAINKTRTGSIKSTYSYMAPEQLQGEQLDCTADIFSLGVIAWEAVVGRRLFKRASDLLTWKAITDEPIPRPSQFRPDLPPELDGAIMHALARRRTERYPSARELALALERAIEPLGTPYTSLAVSAEIEQAFAAELQVQRDRVFSAHKRQEADRLAGGGYQDADDWGDVVAGDDTRVADEEYGSLVAITSGVRDRPPIPRPASEGEVNTPSELHTLDELPRMGPKAAARSVPRSTSDPGTDARRGKRPRHVRRSAPLRSSLVDEVPPGVAPAWPPESTPAGKARSNGSGLDSRPSRTGYPGRTRAKLRSRSALPMVLALLLFGTGAAALAYVLKKNEIDTGPSNSAEPAAGQLAEGPGDSPAPPATSSDEPDDDSSSESESDADAKSDAESDSGSEPGSAVISAIPPASSQTPQKPQEPQESRKSEKSKETDKPR